MISSLLKVKHNDTTKTKPKKTRQRTIHVENVTNLSPFEKSMIDKSEDLKGKQMLLGGKEKKASLPMTKLLSDCPY